jgi:hypothetical protein
MKIINIVIAISLITLTSFGQSFEGEIIYQNTYKSKITGLTAEKLASMMGSTQEYFVKGAEYKSVLNGTLMQWQMYEPTGNRIYTKMSNNESALWTDASVNADSVMGFELNSKSMEILGYPCDELVLHCKSGTQKFYFSSKLALDPKLFKLHKFGNWYAFVSKSKAIPLKIEIENSQFTMTSTAIEVKPMKLADNIFLLPPGINIDKSPY